MRVLHVLPTRASDYGGPVRVAEALCGQLALSGHTAEIFPAVDAPPLTATRVGYWPGIRAMSALSAQIRVADLVHVHGLWTVPTSAASALARAFERPYVITAHGMLDRWSLRNHSARKKMYAALIERANLDAASALHFFNEEEHEEARSFGIRAPAFILPNGVHIAQLTDLPGREALWRQYPQARGKTVVLFLSRLHPKKGLRLLVPAFARIGALSRTLLMIAGPDEGGHRAEVEALVAREGLRGRVIFTGAVTGEDKQRLLGGADLFVLPSYQEGDSVAVKEALAAGLPVVITHACHFSQVAREPAGLVIDPSVQELQHALEQLCGDDVLRARLAVNARPLIEREYTWDKLGTRLMQYYEKLLAQH